MGLIILIIIIILFKKRSLKNENVIDKKDGKKENLATKLKKARTLIENQNSSELEAYKKLYDFDLYSFNSEKLEEIAEYYMKKYYRLDSIYKNKDFYNDEVETKTYELNPIYVEDFSLDFTSRFSDGPRRLALYHNKLGHVGVLGDADLERLDEIYSSEKPYRIEGYIKGGNYKYLDENKKIKIGMDPYSIDLYILF